MTTETRPGIALFAGQTHPCPYLQGPLSRLHFVDPGFDMNPAVFGALLARGFRRSGRHVYRPGCENCRQCIAVRVPVNGFTPSRSQKRCRLHNRDVTVSIERPDISDEHYELYQRYIASRHPDGGMADSGRSDCEDFLIADWCETRFLDLRLDGRLIATAVTDLAPGALSAIYTFFDPALRRRSLGTLSILLQIEIARQWALNHLYLGYWVEHSPKMSYKSRFAPRELLVGDSWTRAGPE